MRGSRLLAGHDVAAKRCFAWTSVIEWQAVRFVNADELVLTTAIGLDEAMLTTFVGRAAAVRCRRDLRQLASKRAGQTPPACCSRRGRRSRRAGDRPSVGDRVCRVNRWAADELLRSRRAATLDGRRRDAPLHGHPARRRRSHDVAAAVETWLTRPALVFDGAMLLIGHGPMAEREMNPDAITNLRLRTAKLSPRDAEDLAGRLHHEEPHHDSGEPKLGLPSGTARCRGRAQKADGLRLRPRRCARGPGP